MPNGRRPPARHTRLPDADRCRGALRGDHSCPSPCFWGYYEMGKSLEERGSPDNELYVRWIEQYTDPGYGEEVQKCRELTDRLGKEASASTVALMEEAFVTSSRYEYLFWEMCYSMERWPV